MVTSIIAVAGDAGRCIDRLLEESFILIPRLQDAIGTYLINKFQDLLAIKVRRGNKMHNNYPTKALGKSFLRKIAAHIGMASSRKLRGEANQL